MKQERILILIGGHLATAPRVQKEAAALKKTGAQVFIRGTWRSSGLAEEDLALAKNIGIDFSAVVDIRDGKGFAVRVMQKIANLAFLKFGVITARVFGLAGPELLREAKRIKADLTMVHSEAGLWAAKKLIAEGYRVGVDFEDWFSQDLPESDRKSRPVEQLQELERYLLGSGVCCFATTRVMAEALAKDAGVSRMPAVIPNCFPASPDRAFDPEIGDTTPTGTVSFYWVSQTIGPGRGLEILAQALVLLKGEWQLALRGDLRGYRDWFHETFPEQLTGRIKLLNPVPNRELMNRAMSHDVGLALEIPYCANKELTASNKIFEYLRAGLAVIATSTLGQQEVMEACPEAGALVEPGNVQALAVAMQLMIDNAILLDNSKKASAQAGRHTWAWEHYEDILANTVIAALAKNQ